MTPLQKLTTASESVSWADCTAIQLPASFPPVLGDSELHVWRVDLDLQTSRIPTLKTFLSPDEAERSNRFVFQLDRDRFIVARAALKAIIELYTGSPAAQLRFSYGPHGKPSLEAKPGHNALRFNLSHSSGFALIAITRDREVGIDLETIRVGFDWKSVAEQLFAPREIATISAHRGEGQIRTFFALWTRKEALAKAQGVGLSLPLKRLDLTEESPGEPILVTADDVSGRSALWRVYDLDVGRDMVAAVAVEDGRRIVRWWDWDVDLPVPSSVHRSRSGPSS